MDRTPTLPCIGWDWLPLTHALHDAHKVSQHAHAVIIQACADMRLYEGAVLTQCNISVLQDVLRDVVNQLPGRQRQRQPHTKCGCLQRLLLREMLAVVVY